MSELIHQQQHGYRNGHQLLASTIRLDRSDQDLVDRLSDLSGQVRPGEVIPAYLTIYPLPSREHVVVARTWPDLKARRAGCVLTRNLIVPRSMWEDADEIKSFVDLLVPFDEDGKLEPLRPPVPIRSLPPFLESNGSELVEAIFLEARKPIVAFGALDPDLIAVRLLTSLWPAFRVNFAICTYALSARKLAGREFDLLFAPKTVRSRFGDWPGRKIEVSSPKSARHRWSAQLAQSIFVAPRPSLAGDDPLGLLAFDSRGDESIFRKTLLWRELAEKANSTPTAVLGLLDILNSQPGTAQRAMPIVGQLLSDGVASTVPNMVVEEAWSFLNTIEGKLRNREELALLNDELERQAELLTVRDPNAAVEFTMEIQDAQVLPNRLLLGIGQGLSKAPASSVFDRLPAKVGSFLLGRSPDFAGLAASALRNGIMSPDVLSDFLRKGEAASRRAAASVVLNEIDSAAFVPIVPLVLSRAMPDELAEWILAILKRTKLKVPELDASIVDTIRDEPTMITLRDAVVSHFSGAPAERFLAQTLKLLPHDIAWLLKAPILPGMSARLIHSVMVRQKDRAVMEAQRDDVVREQLLKVLSSDAKLCASQIARVLLLGAPTIDDLLHHGQNALPYLQAGRQRQELLATIFERGFAEGPASDSRLPILLGDHLDEIGARQVIWWATSDNVPSWRVTQNVRLLVGLPDAVRRLVEASVDDLCERLARRAKEDLGVDAYVGWAELLWESQKTAPKAYLKGAFRSLSATIDLTRKPVSDVIAAAFPGVYRELLSRKYDEPDGFVGLMFLIPRMLISDWDQAKPARHGLVDAFLSSNWPPAHLFLAAYRAGILDRICLRVARQRGGEKYLERAASDLDRLTKAEASAIRNGLSSIGRRDMRDEWD